MKILVPLIAIAALVVVAFVGASFGLMFLFGIVVPYIALALFVIGFIYRIVTWAKSPVPFNIPTTTGQEKSLPWIKSNEIESPSTAGGVLVRMALEVLLFRSLFRNTSFKLRGGKFVFTEEKLLWLAGLAFHWSMLIIVLRHFRFFTQPAPFFVPLLQSLDGFFQVGVPVLYITTALVIVALLYLFVRRLIIPQVRYISLPSDYFPLFLILSIAITGMLMRHFFRVDVEGVKQLAMGLVQFQPVLPTGVSPLFYTHIFLVSTLLAYFPLSKLMHAGGIFLSPTRNLANDSRMRRHVNPWNYPVKTHTYEEWQDEHRKVLVAAGYELDEETSKKEDVLV